jgi:hypothetical protein
MHGYGELKEQAEAVAAKSKGARFEPTLKAGQIVVDSRGQRYEVGVNGNLVRMGQGAESIATKSTKNTKGGASHASE